MQFKPYRWLGGALVFSVGVAGAKAETIQVTIDKLAFTPVVVNARLGDTIEWVNNDVVAHTATVKGDWDVMLPAKKAGRVMLKRTGTLEYYCRFHPNMKGRISVIP